VLLPNLAWWPTTLMSRVAEQAFIGVRSPTFHSDYVAGFQWASLRLPPPWAGTQDGTSTFYEGQGHRRRRRLLAAQQRSERERPGQRDAAQDVMLRLGVDDALEMLLGHLFWAVLALLCVACVLSVVSQLLCKDVASIVVCVGAMQLVVLLYMPLCTSAWRALVTSEGMCTVHCVRCVLCVLLFMCCIYVHIMMQEKE
jgi:hypothetical protein